MRRSTSPAKLAEFLREMRHKAGKTQDDVATAMRVPAEHVVRIESGRVEPKLTTVVRFLEALASRLTLVVDTDRPAAKTAPSERNRRRPKRAAPRSRARK